MWFIRTVSKFVLSASTVFTFLPPHSAPIRQSSTPLPSSALILWEGCRSSALPGLTLNAIENLYLPVCGTNWIWNGYRGSSILQTDIAWVSLKLKHSWCCTESTERLLLGNGGCFQMHGCNLSWLGFVSKEFRQFLLLQPNKSFYQHIYFLACWRLGNPHTLLVSHGRKTTDK